MRLVVVLAAGTLALGGLSACTDSEADEVNGDAPPSAGPTAVVEAPQPTKSPKHRKKKKAAPSVSPQPAVPPTLQPELTLPPGEEFDPEHYDPEGDRDPADPADPTASEAPDPGGSF